MQTEGLDAVKQALAAYPVVFRDVVAEAFLDGAAAITAWEQANHLWRNQTGMAEALLHCDVVVESEDNSIWLVNAHGVPYGVYLEYMQFGRYAILLTALRTFFFGILEDAARRIREEAPRLQGGGSR